jgi:Replication-relaxation
MKASPQPRMLTPRDERIVYAIGAVYRYMLASDVVNLFFSPSSLTYVREALAGLAGGADFAEGYYLYRFPLPSTTRDNRTKVYTLGAAGRQYLLTEYGLSCDWQARPGKQRLLSHSALLHNLLLTRLVVSAHLFCRRSTGYTLSETRLSYELSQDQALLSHPFKGHFPQALLVPDAWVCFTREDGLLCPVLLELDRSMEHKARFKAHVASRLDLITSGLYERVFAHTAVKIAYVTIGESERATASRRATMCAWTKEVLAEAGVPNWASVFYFAAISPKEIYQRPDFFVEACWQQPGSDSPVALLPPP